MGSSVLTVAADSALSVARCRHPQFYSRNNRNKLASFRSFPLAPPQSSHSSPLLVSRFRKKTRRLSVRLFSINSVGGVNLQEGDWCELGRRRRDIYTHISMASSGRAVLYVMDLLLVVFAPLLAIREVNGDNGRYSKFASEGKKKEAMIASKTGMLVIYFPAALLATVLLACRLDILPLAAFLKALGASGAAAFWEHALVADADDRRLLVVAAVMCIHFSKRVLEVLFVHNYSGSTGVSDTVQISISYTTQVGFFLYSQLLSASSGARPPFPNLKWLGVALFLVGATGNAYHHWILSHLRKDGNRKYVVPQGGLFGLLVCPHYVFEMVDYVGIALVSQTLFAACQLWFVVWYLTGRAVASKQWYLKKVEGFPEERRVLIPGVF